MQTILHIIEEERKKMAKLYELINEIENFEFEIDEETGEILNMDALDSLEIAKTEKIENLCLWVKNLKSDEEAYKAEKNSFAKKERAAKNKAESVRNYIQSILAGEKFKTDRVMVSYRKSEAVECSDVYAVDDDYLNYAVPTVDKTAVKKAIKAGIEVKGCTLVEKQNMQIK